ncbi:MAG: glycosyl hydrolase [Bernardetiaceae bacterium]|nr:glycosyl hydrolase [Bernardetiaceae bacterium]
MRKLLLLISILLVGASASLQAQEVSPTASALRLEAFEKQQKKPSYFKGIAFRNVGPTVTGGRVVDLEANPERAHEFYAAFASGGLWHTTNNGASFTPIFDNQATITIGDIAIDWQRKHIWIGTGENNSSRSSYAGTGIYFSDDNGQTWQHKGLTETQHIGRVLLHPQKTNTLWVAAMGNLYADNPERGVYKSEDGGTTWQKTLFIDDKTGVIDLVIDPENPEILYASTWQRLRKAWNFEEAGEGSAIYKSEDGGNKWQKISGKASGFPEGESVGRIGLAISPSAPQTLYALLDDQSRREDSKDPKDDPLAREKLLEMSNTELLKIEDEKLNTYLKKNYFPQKYNATTVKTMIKSEEIKPADLVYFQEDANRELFDTPVKGAMLYRSDDGGRSWTLTHEGYIDDVYYSYGYYFGEVRVDAKDSDKVYILGVPILRSDDGGKNWISIGSDNVHVDHHALWLHPEISGYIINGNDGGINISYDDGAHWHKCNRIPVAQFYTVWYDMQEPYNVYGGTQDNGVWYGSSAYRHSTQWEQEGEYPYKRLMGGDGMQVRVDMRDNQTIYTGYQFGNYYRISPKGRKKIQPMHKLGERPLRFNWQTPIWLSTHNPDVLYFGSNKFHRSLDKGNTWDYSSEDLTRGGKKGDVPYSTLTSIHESPLRFGLIYVGSDDGLVHKSQDGGYTWERLMLPEAYQDFWVSRVQASAHALGRVYVSLNGYRFDNFESLVFVSEDFGQSWQRIASELPFEPVNVVIEDPQNANLIYIGTDNGLYVSLDKGEHCMPLGNLPRVAVHDLALQPRAQDLIVGTHGRSIYIGNMRHLASLNEEVLAQTIHIFPNDNNEIKHNPKWGKPYWSRWSDFNEPTYELNYWLGSAAEVEIAVYQEGNNKAIFSEKQNLEKGMHAFTYKLNIQADKLKALQSKTPPSIADNEKYYLPIGKYNIQVSIGKEQRKIPLEIKEAEAMPILPKPRTKGP